MIGRNRHPVDGKKKYGRLVGKMPAQYREQLGRILKTKAGQKVLKKYRQLTGLPWPTEIVKLDVPGPKNKAIVLASIGKSPQVQLADGPTNRASSVKKVRGRGWVATDSSGKRIFILSGKNSNAPKGKLKFAGWAPETHYVLSDAEENAGSFKRGKYWVHEHKDEGGKWPKVFKDQAGNFFYAPGTYRVGKWIRK
jgi:hypothetical protein